MLLLSIALASSVFSCQLSDCKARLRGAKAELRHNSVHGHLIEKITLSNCCAPERAGGAIDDTLKIISIDSVDGASYGPAVLRSGDEILLRNVPGNADFIFHPSLSSITLKAEWGEPTCIMGMCRRDLCLNAPSYLGNAPIVCRHYSQIPAGSDAAFVEEEPEVCNIVASSCSATHVSQSMFSFTGPAIECLTDTLRQNFFERQPGCILSEDTDANVNMSFLASFSAFQEALKVSVRALLILYTIGYGIKIILNQDEFSAESAIKFVLKMILVGYFAVGWGPAYFQDGVKTTKNGTLEWALPILTQVTSDFASMAFGAASAGRGLCEFDNDNYPKGHGYYGLFDRIDCKLGAYFMVKKVYGFGFLATDTFDRGWRKIRVLEPPASDSRPESDFSLRDYAQDTAQVGLWIIIFRFILGGQFLICIALLYFMVIIISLLLGFISLYTICLVTLHVLIYLSPIFVPMALFQRTQNYFESWFKVTLSCALQPMVMATFMAMMFTLYDDVLFGTCEFRRHDYTDGNSYKSVFEIMIPRDDPAPCMTSTGYLIISYVLGHGADSVGALLFTVEFLRDELNLWLNALILLAFSYIMRFFMDSLYTFAADLTGGLNVAGVALSMSKMADTMNKGIEFAANKLASAGKKKDGGGGKGYENKGGSRGGAESPSMGKDSGDKKPSMGKGGGDNKPSMGGGGKGD